MKAAFRTLFVFALGTAAVTACAAGGDQALVSPSQPHAIISTALPPAPNYYRVKIVWLDGNYLSNQGRQSSFWVKPGTHKIGFRAIINPNRGPNVMSNPAMSAPQNMPTLTLDLKQGYSYYFGAAIPKGGNVSKWHPVVIKTEQNGG